MTTITLPDFNSIFVYDEASPTFLRWKSTLLRKDGLATKAMAGRVAGGFAFDKRYSKGDPKITYVGYNNRMYRIHRVVWVMHFGAIPEGKVLDHIDGNPFNNSIKNLRLADGFENAWNAKKSKRNTSGVKGVYFSNRHKKWVAEISFNKKRKCLGMFESIDCASNAVAVARADFHKDFARHA